jgi:hypothetical protein
MFITPGLQKKKMSCLEKVVLECNYVIKVNTDLNCIKYSEVCYE